MKIDPCLVICVLALAVLMPIGFTIDHKPYVGKCAASPHLYLGNHSSISNIINAINASNYSIKIVSSARYFHAPLQDSNDLINCLNNKAQNGVKIDIVDNNALNPNSLIKKIDYIQFKNDGYGNNLFMTLIIIDNKRVVFASQMFTLMKSSSASDFVLDFEDCESIAAESIEIFNFVKKVAAESLITLFPHYYSPGYSYPQEHFSIDKKSSYLFSITPEYYVCPNRKFTKDLIHEFFTEKIGNISLFSGELFPTSHNQGNIDDMFLITNLIETAASKQNSSVRIVTQNSKNSSICDATLSLSRVKGVQLRVNTNNYATYFVHDDSVVFMPMSFNAAYENSVILLALRIKNIDIANEVLDHFNYYWENSTHLDNCSRFISSH
ncbi:hypothetical protein TVAG_192900 [Trichomonas vaginalis G3]|uniref:Phospholipase D-like domain-containing protein n=1 Tax=Trichomonas vaginalis (strain ATCC PRA-98 / G3) TaxID=412133 RepID=A2DH04_TRIV3|nr:phospholipase D/nuclease family [Trichomonas vaginalis G3]EAY20314.1 hypothetical protein TVAG_192900 [Trichomonas vaginalis G3]KAI5530697.1 phospholipase D/nuclease family [Trichomonas vaginalis G3]|eukprot:XP_001581300.1 hypothetical protein [Trichomonas vaginalis G3]